MTIVLFRINFHPSWAGQASLQHQRLKTDYLGLTITVNALKNSSNVVDCIVMIFIKYLYNGLLFILISITHILQIVEWMNV